MNDCPDCQDENHYCKVHQKHESEVYHAARHKGRHDTQQFRMELLDARRRDMYESEDQDTETA